MADASDRRLELIVLDDRNEFASPMNTAMQNTLTNAIPAQVLYEEGVLPQILPMFRQGTPSFYSTEEVVFSDRRAVVEIETVLLHERIFLPMELYWDPGISGSNLGSRISDLGSRISDLGSRI